MSSDPVLEFAQQQRARENGCFIRLAAFALLLAVLFTTCRYQLCLAVYNDHAYCAYSSCSKYPSPPPPSRSAP